MAYTNEELVSELQELGYVKTQRIADAFLFADRKLFVPEDMREHAYENTALPIGFAQTISQPLVVAFMLELLGVQEGDTVLEVGTGSGWKAALLAYLVSGGSEAKDAGKPLVFSIERINELLEGAQRTIHTALPGLDAVISFLKGDGSKGYEAGAPYNKIIAAAAGESICDAWKEQLKIGGRIVAPVGESIVVIEKIGKDEFEQREYYGFSFVPLIKGE